jgi:hypothetical protein
MTTRPAPRPAVDERTPEELAKERAGRSDEVQVVTLAQQLLPTGRPIDDDSWRQRHRTVTLLLWAHVGGLAVYGVVRGVNLAHLAIEIVAITALAAVANVARSRRLESSAATVGLVSCSALLVHLSGGVIEAHFHFFIMVAVVTLYQSWLPFLLAMAFVVVHHGTVGILDPHSVYNHAAAVNRPWLWALIHGMFVTGAALANLRSWKHAELERERAEAAAVRLHERQLRHHEAVQLNDTVLQGLVTAKYAAQLGQADRAAAAIEQTLVLARDLVSDLVADDADLSRPGGLRRERPASMPPAA